jgi:predicted nucleotidyltransferase component of viral defense system
MIKQMLSRYDIKNDDDYYNALREVFQEIALAGLYRGNFFEKAAFYGGTALRIFYNLNRFSEDLDFSLLVPQKDFSLKPYFKAIKDEFEALGIKC